MTWRWEKNPKDLIDEVGRKYKRSETVRDRDRHEREAAAVEEKKPPCALHVR